MSQYFTNGFESGTSGTTISAANSAPPAGAGSKFDVVTVGSGGSLTYDTTHVAHGSLACKIASTTAASTFLEWTNASFGSQSSFWWRGYFYFTANPAATIRLFNCTTATGATSVMSCSLTSGGLLVVSYSSAGTTFVTFTAAIPLNQWFRVEGRCVVSTTVGLVAASLYDSMDSATATETHTSAATLNTGTLSGTTDWAFGDSNGIGSVGPYWIDDAGLSDSGGLGPAQFAGTAAGTVTLAGAPAGAKQETQAVTAAMAFTPTPAGSKRETRTVTAALLAAGVAAGLKAGTGSPAAAGVFAAAAAGAKRSTAAGTAAVTLTATCAGQAVILTPPGIIATATGPAGGLSAATGPAAAVSATTAPAATITVTTG